MKHEKDGFQDVLKTFEKIMDEALKEKDEPSKRFDSNSSPAPEQPNNTLTINFDKSRGAKAGMFFRCGWELLLTGKTKIVIKR